MNANLPILLIAYNRPEMVLRSINKLREIKPRKIYFAVDGPKINSRNDSNKVQDCIKNAKYIDWECEVYTKFSPINQGCALGVSSAISWVFENEDFVLVLEDDIEINKDFYEIASKLLFQYRDSKEIFAICASNISNFSHNRAEESYFFTKYFAGWGWATWKDRWQDYDVRVFEKQKIDVIKILKYSNFNPIVTIYFLYNFYKVKCKKLDTWDYQINYLIMKNNLMVIKMSRNFSKNHGIGEDATHTKKLPYYNFYDEKISVFRHPEKIDVNILREKKHRAQLSQNLIKSLIVK